MKAYKRVMIGVVEVFVEDETNEGDNCYNNYHSRCQN